MAPGLKRPMCTCIGGLQPWLTGVPTAEDPAFGGPAHFYGRYNRKTSLCLDFSSSFKEVEEVADEKKEAGGLIAFFGLIC